MIEGVNADYVSRHRASIHNNADSNYRSYPYSGHTAQELHSRPVMMSGRGTRVTHLGARGADRGGISVNAIRTGATTTQTGAIVNAESAKVEAVLNSKWKTAQIDTQLQVMNHNDLSLPIESDNDGESQDVPSPLPRHEYVRSRPFSILFMLFTCLFLR